LASLHQEYRTHPRLRPTEDVRTYGADDSFRNPMIRVFGPSPELRASRSATTKSSVQRSSLSLPAAMRSVAICTARCTQSLRNAWVAPSERRRHEGPVDGTSLLSTPALSPDQRPPSGRFSRSAPPDSARSEEHTSELQSRF